jgi:lipoate-protein ligase A
MHLCETTLPTLAENLAFDEALLLHAETGGPETLRLWEWPYPAVVVGAAGKLADEIDENACRADDVPIGRRSSGGGTVLLGAGCQLYSLILRFERDPALADLRASYRFILGNILDGLRPLVPELSMQGTSDLALGDRKFSGNAQQRKRTHCCTTARCFMRWTQRRSRAICSRRRDSRSIAADELTLIS